MNDLYQCFQTVFGDVPRDLFGEQMNLADINGWDSMASINLILELEGRYGVDLSEVEIPRNARVESIVNMLRERGVEI